MNMDYDKGYAQTTAYNNISSEAPPNFASSVELAGDRVNELVLALAELADRLCGAAPSDQKGGPVAVPSGLFDATMDRAQAIIRRADAGIEHVNRIRRSLP